MKKFLTYIFPITLAIVVVVNLLFSEFNYASKQEALNDKIALGDVVGQSAIYWELIVADSLNVQYHFQFIRTYYYAHKKWPTESLNQLPSKKEVLNFYRKISYSYNNTYADIGKLGRGMCYYYLGLIDEAMSSFVAIQNQDLPYLNYIYGSFFSYANQQKNINYLRQEVVLNPENKMVYNELAQIFVNNEQPYVLKAFIKDPVVKENVSYKYRRYANFKVKDYDAYALAIFDRFFDGVNLLGFTAALLILIVWFTYLIFIHKYLRKRWVTALVILLLGMGFAFGTSLLTDFNNYVLDFKLDGDFINDFIYCVFGIGFVEEFVKVVPLLLVLIFSKTLREPIDYIVFASISALGFAFIENLVYFDEGGLKTIQGRSLSATVTHMFNSSLVAYGFVIGRFAKKRNWWLYAIGFYCAAALFHGFYDFWLLNKVARSFSFITFIWLLMSMVLWVSIINNCLNNSYIRNILWTYNPDKLNSILLFGLSAIFLLEYFIIGWKFGADAANEELQKDFSSGLFLLIFLTTKLSKFDYVPNYWGPLKFWDWNLIFSLPRVEVKQFRLSEIIGSEILIEQFNEFGVLSKHLPIKAEVVKRELLSWEKDWFLVKLEKPLKVGWKEQYFLMLKTKDANAVFLSSKKQPVQVRLVNNIDDLVLQRKKKKDFLFVDLAVVTRL